MKKIYCLLICCSLAALGFAQGIDLDNFANIDTMMEDNALTDVANRYSSVQLSYFPEYATRIGFESANNKLDNRSVERDSQALRAFRIVQDALKEINRKNLSEPRKTDYDILQARLTLDMHQINQNRPTWDPLLYSQVFNAVYDLRSKELTYRNLQDRDLATRVMTLPSQAAQTKKNLLSAPSFLAQIAMEDAYYAYLSFDDITSYLMSRAQDEVSQNQVRSDARQAKLAIKEIFEWFKQLAQDNSDQDFRFGEKSYETILQNRYFIDMKSRKLEKYLTKNFHAAQQALAKALRPFDILGTETVSSGILVEDIPTLEEPSVMKADNDTTAEEPAPAPIPQTTKEKNKKQTPAALVRQFYAVAKRITENTPNQNFVTALAEEAANLSKFFTQDDTLPVSNVAFRVKEMPAYYAYTRMYLFMPPFGAQTNPSYDFFLRMPGGNALTQQDILDQQYNAPTLKLIMAGQLVPGLAYRASYGAQKLSAFRKMYPVPTLRNGWETYAQHLANERGYIITDEEQLFLAWADYVRAAHALVDFYLHTRKFGYSEALNWLVSTNGFDKTQAEALLKNSAAYPGEAVSYIYGYDVLKNLRAKYQKKLGKKFSLADFHAKLMSVGDIPPNRLEDEMEHTYLIEKNHLTQALSTPFYMN